MFAGLGMENRAQKKRGPVVFAADSISHAASYAWPSNFLKDNLYYGIMFQLEVEQEAIVERRRDEVLVDPRSNIRIKSLYLLCNLDISTGGHRCVEPDPSLELLPQVLRQRRGTLLHEQLARPTAWHT